MLYILQLPEAAEAARKIGLEQTVILILLIALVGGFSLILRWLIRRTDEKDKQLLAEIDKRSNDQARIEAALRQTADAVKESTANMKTGLEALAQEIRRNHDK